MTQSNELGSSSARRLHDSLPAMPAAILAWSAILFDQSGNFSTFSVQKKMHRVAFRFHLLHSENGLERLSAIVTL